QTPRHVKQRFALVRSDSQAAAQSLLGVAKLFRAQQEFGTFAQNLRVLRLDAQQPGEELARLLRFAQEALALGEAEAGSNVAGLTIQQILEMDRGFPGPLLMEQDLRQV